MALEYRKFTLVPDQMSPEGSTGMLTVDGGIIWIGEEGTFPESIISEPMTAEDIETYFWQKNLAPLYSNIKRFIEHQPNGAIRYDTDLKLNIMLAMQNAIAAGNPMPEICTTFKAWITAVQGEFFTLKAQIEAGQSPDISYDMLEGKYGEDGTVLPDPHVTTTTLALAGLL